MIYELSRIIFRLIFVFYFRWEVYGLENIIGARGGIIAVNHTSFLDPALIGVVIPGKIHYVAKRELFKNRLVRWYLTKLNGIPIDRDKPNIDTLKRLIELTRRGNLVVMFPEGTRSLDESLGEGRLGVGLLAAKARATIYPCYISGSGEAMPKGARFFRPRKVRLAFGKPVGYDNLYNLAPSKEAYKEISCSIMEEIGKLKKMLEERAGKKVG